MNRPSPWFERKFAFDLDVERFPGLIERLRGTPARLEERVARVDPGALTWHPAAGSWSIQEHAGHLGDLEGLWFARVEETLAGARDLSPADLKNRKTHEAGHDRRVLAEILSEFRASRARLVARLEPLESPDLERTALHPRLRTPMRLIDQAFFVAEHDDHHLATITWLLARARGAPA
jgi:uncharacterized damage-inducible protein DinB